MGTKDNPGKYDCHAEAEPDEPMFVLLARDPLAPYLVHIWRHLRRHQWIGARAALGRAITCAEGRPLGNAEKCAEAYDCGNAMGDWRREKKAAKK